jgi:hypothetical protein
MIPYLTISASPLVNSRGGRVSRKERSMKTALGWAKVPRRFLAEAGFAPDAAVHLGEKGRGHLDVGNPSHVDGGDESGEVSGHAPAQGDERRSPVSAPFEEAFGQFDAGVNVLGILPGGEHDFFRREPPLFQDRQHPVPVKSVHPVIQEEEVAAAPPVLG